ncbi:unnamed protein product [Caenorhabditis auriculariae]|uniref:Neurotransmitter-gated ion-channel ligand-binding domain-containing protein n=1 Tax=Caenorhabditis auriculariae TaxID=2777116 RepID=A0A8S1I050_9PELO|nr:unnamed protein product [Caenorhabditis auriculariae]
MVLLAVKENDREADFLYSYSMTWYDERLRFNATEYNQTTVYIPVSELWIPPFYAYNTIEVVQNDGESDYVKIFSDGLVRLRKTLYARFVCEVDVSRFPFDTQYCVIAYSSPSISIDQCDAVPRIDGNINLQGNSEFKCFNQSVAERSYLVYSATHRTIFFIAHLKRYPTYYIVMVVIPTFFICVVTITGALVPLRKDESNDIVGLGLGSILALIFMLSIVADKLPKTPGLAWLGYYVIEALVLCTLTLGLGFIRGQATSRMELTRKPGRIVHFLTRVDASVWDSDNRVSDLSEKNKTPSSARSDGPSWQEAPPFHGVSF